MRDFYRCGRLLAVEVHDEARRCGQPATRWVGFREVRGSIHPRCDDCFKAETVAPGVSEFSYEEVVVMEVLES